MKQAFTLIEMLVVIAIIGVLSSMAIMAVRPDSSFLVENAARDLEATLAQARSLTRRTQRPYGVTFHLENAGNGSVLQNFSENDPPSAQGRHWYAIVGPRGSNRFPPGMPTTVDDSFSNRNDRLRYWCMLKDDDGDEVKSAGYDPDLHGEFGPTIVDDKDRVYVNALLYTRFNTQRAMVGDRQHLPRGVRFLAISDYDLGFCDRDIGSEKNRYRDGLYRTAPDSDKNFPMYPRPWFGVLMPIDKLATELRSDNGRFVLFPWGGYDPQVNTSCNIQGLSGLGSNGSGAPLLDGMLLDHFIVFRPDGAVNTGRVLHSRVLIQEFEDTGMQVGSEKDEQGNAPMTAMNHPFGWSGPMQVSEAWGIMHDLKHTGGYSITLCRDIEEDDPRQLYPLGDRYDVFDSEEDALQSITPLARVYVNAANGESEVRRQDHPLCETRMNQRKISVSDIEAVSDFGDAIWHGWTSDQTTKGCMTRPAHRHGYFADHIANSLQDGNWHDGPEGWKGWFPAYEE